MRTAITTRFIPPTNFRGARVVANAAKGQRLYSPWQHGWTIEENHTHAAGKLADKLGWSGFWYGGGTEEGYCFVMRDGDPAFSVRMEEAA